MTCKRETRCVRRAIGAGLKCIGVEHMSRVELCQHICLMFDRGRDLSTTNTPTRCGSQGPLVVPTFSQLALVTNL